MLAVLVAIAAPDLSGWPNLPLPPIDVAQEQEALQEALAQVEAGADLLDVNVGAAGVDEADLLPKAVKLVLETVDPDASLASHCCDVDRESD
mgnify:CR=1 FL=1